jgi:hypothetical protein
VASNDLTALLSVLDTRLSADLPAPTFTRTGVGGFAGSSSSVGPASILSYACIGGFLKRSKSFDKFINETHPLTLNKLAAA